MILESSPKILGIFLYEWIHYDFTTLDTVKYKLLKEFALFLQDIMPKNGLLYRLHSDEFAYLSQEGMDIKELIMFKRRFPRIGLSTYLRLFVLPVGKDLRTSAFNMFFNRFNNCTIEANIMPLNIKVILFHITYLYPTTPNVTF